MNPLSVLMKFGPLLMKVWCYVRDSKSFWAIVRNWYWIKSKRDAIEEILKDIQTTRSLPNQAQVKILIGIVREALDKGLIDLPNVNEATLSFELSKIEANLISQVQKISKEEIK